MHTDNTVIKSNFPRWFVVYFCVCLGITFASFVFFLFRKFQLGITGYDILGITIFFVVCISGLFFLSKLLFYSVEASELGLRSTNIFGSDRMFFWDNIVEVKPFIWRYSDFIFVISKEKEKMLLVKSMKGYQEIIEMMKERVSTLKIISNILH